MQIVGYSNNMSSIVRSNLTKSSNLLNTAIERLSTGYKINGAKDNAANYAITSSMSSKISSYEVAEENANMGLDMVQTANSAMDSISDLTTRLRYLAEQAHNGTYGADSLRAINQEAESLVQEIDRIKSNAEYNGISLMNGGGNISSYMSSLMSSKAYLSKDFPASGYVSVARASGPAEGRAAIIEASGGLRVKTTDSEVWFGFSDLELNTRDLYTPSDVLRYEMSYGFGASGVSGVSGSILTSMASGTGTYIDLYSVVRCASMTSGTGISYFDSESSRVFFNASGYNASGYALFFDPDFAIDDESRPSITDIVCSYIPQDALTVDQLKANKNGFVEDAHLYNDNDIDALVHVKNLQDIDFYARDHHLAFAISDVDDLRQLEFLVNSGVDTSGCAFILCADIDMSGESDISIGSDYRFDGFKGLLDGNGHKILNLTQAGGLFGFNNGTIQNLGLENVNIDGTLSNSDSDSIGGLADYSSGQIKNCYVTGDVVGKYRTGGLVGASSGDIIKSYTSGSVVSQLSEAGGIAGYASFNYMTNVFSTASVESKKDGSAGGLVGFIGEDACLFNSYATGNVDTNTTYGGEGYAGGLIGKSCSSSFIANCYSSGDVNGHNGNAGGLIGASTSVIINSYTTGKVNSNNSLAYVGGMVGIAAAGGITGGYSSEVNPGLKSVGYIPTNYYDIGSTIDNLTPMKGGSGGLSLSLQIGLGSDSGSQINVDISPPSGDLNSIVSGGLESAGSLEAIDNYLAEISQAQVKLGAAENRLSSTLESIHVAYDNLVSSRSTLRDADVGEVSSQYIKYQILQQASATLLATANQTPSLTLRLLGAL